MSSTNVHSNNYKHICGGQTIPETPDKSLKMPPKAAGRGPSRIEVIEGEKAVINAQSNLVVKNKDKVVGRATLDGKVLSVNAQAVKKALEDKDMEK